ncbi:hypothetical protein RAAC3_TM7C00001G0368 [Candidatus Saccharibacteria bacterium RAAC3_TM7_1]|nr:hypothetical protein RAAC3_TM7C00001G0368 [Candidatus Saccharibacteria bacterium RAAC3_TM7_1]
MINVRRSSTVNQAIEQAAVAVAESLHSQLQTGKSVLWLLSGGSSLTIATEAANLLTQTDTTNLYVTLTDERYGLVGHKDENWQQLLDSGFQLQNAQLYRPLTGGSLGDTTADFNTWLERTLALTDYKLGIFGIGADGHTAGIKPHSPAVISQQFATSFKGDDFTRITITPAVIGLLNEVVIQASGADKQTILEEVLSLDVPTDDQPAQLLKNVHRSTLYTTNTLEGDL